MFLFRTTSFERHMVLYRIICLYTTSRSYSNAGIGTVPYCMYVDRFVKAGGMILLNSKCYIEFVIIRGGIKRTTIADVFNIIQKVPDIGH